MRSEFCKDGALTRATEVVRGADGVEFTELDVSGSPVVNRPPTGNETAALVAGVNRIAALVAEANGQ